MTIHVSAGSPAGPENLGAAKAAQTLLANQRARLLASALALRNGISFVLAGLIGYALFKGRADVIQLAPAAAVSAGILLISSFGCGLSAAALLMRVDRGLCRALSIGDLVAVAADAPFVEESPAAAATASAAWFRRGVALSLCCLALLFAAVALVWYGPPKGKPQIEVRLLNGSLECGEAISTGAGKLTIETPRGQFAIDLTQVTGLAAVELCATSS
jgi:hypothetical protein